VTTRAVTPAGIRRDIPCADNRLLISDLQTFPVPDPTAVGGQEMMQYFP